ncbi:MAG: hypothetical protein WAQ98_11140 [Blastocatellia bacterium]
MSKTRTKSSRRKASLEYSFFQDGERHSLSANKYWKAIRAGWLIQSNYNERIAFVSDKYKAVFDSIKRNWDFVVTETPQKTIFPIKMMTMTELIMKLSIYAGQPNSWREVIPVRRKAPSSHPTVFILR